MRHFGWFSSQLIYNFLPKRSINNEVDDPEYEIPEILLVSIHFLAEIDSKIWLPYVGIAIKEGPHPQPPVFPKSSRWEVTTFY